MVTNALRLKKFKVSKAEHTSVKEESEQEAMLQSMEIDEIKEEKTMITMKINGMMCPHCQAAVKKALEAFEGVTADVNLEDKAAYITGEADKDALVKAVTDAGYEVVSVE